MKRSQFSTAVLILAFGGTVAASDTVDYERQIKPIFKQRCYACHGALKQKAQLRLDTGMSIRKGGEAGPAVLAGQADESPLVERLTEADASLRMPPEGSPLNPEQLSLVKRWIDQGATSPEGERPETDPLKHWSFLPPVRPALPLITSADRSPIDVFLSATLEKKGLSRLARAEPHEQIRRLYLDLIGLPPTRDELHAFLADPSDKAYRQVVDRLLASPQYGERWARHWMDVWRYSDWYGRRAVPDVLNSYGQIWRWRDWIVRTLNEDRGYDSMVRSMLAADEISPNDPSEVVATGFLVRNFYRWNYNLWMKDNVEHTGKAFLGLTFNCAHCHDHKYDPIKHEDYFALRAIFEPLDLRHDRVPGEPDPGPYPKYEYGKAYKPITSGLVRVFDKDLDAKTFLYTRGESRNVVAGRPPISPGMPAFLGGVTFHLDPVNLPKEVVFPGLQDFVRREELSRREAALAKADKSLKKTDNAIAAAKAGGRTDLALDLQRKVDAASRAAALAELSALHARISADDAGVSKASPTFEARKQLAARAEKWAATSQAAVSVARCELDLSVAKTKSEVETTKAQAKLDAALKALQTAQADLKSDATEYTPLSPTYPSKSTGRRAALARWITSPTNPLAARVAVNHLWRWHFGTPLVATTQDFGRNGAAPTHPELLDWLAVELMSPSTSGAQPWSLKAIHRLIVTSESYRMRSHPESLGHAGFRIDPDNRSYWHFPAARMEAEVVRDSLLHVAGTLDRTVGGPDIDFAQGLSSRRRSLYFTYHGEARMPFLETFDAADSCDAYKRTMSVVPQQSLALVNNDFLLDLSRTLSARLWEETTIAARDPSDALNRFLTASFESVLSRPPTSDERRLANGFISEQAGIIKRESQVKTANADDSPDARARRDLIHALFSHTDFLTIH